MSRQTLEGLQAELSCWRGSLATLEVSILEADTLEAGERSFLSASLALQERMILETIADLTAKLAAEAARVETRTRRKHARAFSG